MHRIDISETIKRIDFPGEVWEWLDLFGDIVAITQREAMLQEKTFVADTPFKKILLCSINKDLSTLSAIYILLRCEQIHQASSHVRLLCESLITLKYISLDAETRSALFWGYADIEAYGISSSLLEWEGATAHPMHVEKVRVFHKSIAEKYENAKDTYTFIDKKERRRAFSNWCNRSMSLQAQDCGPSFQRLYELVYRQMSAYIHGTAWSLRRQVSYSRDHYDLKVILNDVASIIRTTTAVWAEWAKFCIEVLDWKLSETIPAFIARLEDLERKHFL